MALKQRIKDYFTNNYRPDEALLLQKIDFFILTFCCLSYFVNYVCLPCLDYSIRSLTVIQLDRTNLGNAYVSGMREDLGFEGDQLNQINTCFTVGYAISHPDRTILLRNSFVLTPCTAAMFSDRYLPIWPSSTSSPVSGSLS